MDSSLYHMGLEASYKDSGVDGQLDYNAYHLDYLDIRLRGYVCLGTLSNWSEYFLVNFQVSNLSISSMNFI